MARRGEGRTVTLKPHCTVPQPFEATQVTGFEPTGNREPEGGVQNTAVPVGTTATEKFTRALLLQVSIVMSAGH